jgi:hypothetical protein
MIGGSYCCFYMGSMPEKCFGQGMAGKSSGSAAARMGTAANNKKPLLLASRAARQAMPLQTVGRSCCATGRTSRPCQRQYCPSTIKPSLFASLTWIT